MFLTQVRVGLDNRLRQVSGTGGARAFQKSLLSEMLPGVAGQPMSIIKVERLDKSETIYSQYRGGLMWKPTARGLGFNGEEFPCSIGVLTLPQFLEGVGELKLRNDVGARWTADTSQLRLEPRENELLMLCHQTPSIEGCTNFGLSGKIIPTFGRFNGYARLDFKITDFLGNQRTLALFDDGRRTPWLGIKSGRYFSRVFMISSDGIRLRIIYGRSREFNVAVLYCSNPSRLYSIELSTSGGVNLAPLKADICVTGEVKLVRRLEQCMEFQGTAYDHARLGAEIAYAVAHESLKLGRIFLFEPSRGGKDLVSSDGGVVIQARMLVRTHNLTSSRIKDEVIRNTRDLLAKLGQDFRYNTSAERGLAVLTYVDDRNTLNLISYLRVRTGQR